MQELLNFQQKTSKLIDQLYLFIKMYVVKEQHNKSNITEVVISLIDLTAGFSNTKFLKLKKNLKKKNKKIK